MKLFIFRKKIICLIAYGMAHTTGCGISTECRRLTAVTGDGIFKKNDVIACGSPATAKQHIIYFGGDVQDYKENMEKYNLDYAKWDLETTARLLQSRFSESAVFVIKPSEMLLNTFSLYRNFLDFDLDGKPQFSASCRYGAFAHLSKLYKKAIKVLAEKSCEKEIESIGEASCGKNVPVKIVGFSKGSVVLNQLMYELNYFIGKDAKLNEEVEEFLARVSSVYWLDGGHTGGRGAYITDDETLQVMVDWNRDIILHVTPYQIKDPMRKWIGREENQFVEKLKRWNAKITEYRHFMDEQGSIENHFKVLTKV